MIQKFLSYIFLGLLISACTSYPKSLANKKYSYRYHMQGECAIAFDSTYYYYIVQDGFNYCQGWYSYNSITKEIILYSDEKLINPLLKKGGYCIFAYKYNSANLKKNEILFRDARTTKFISYDFSLPYVGEFKK